MKTPKPKDANRPQLNIRFDREELDIIVRAAGDHFPSTWARVALLRAAREEVRKQKRTK